MSQFIAGPARTDLGPVHRGCDVNTGLNVQSFTADGNASRRLQTNTRTATITIIDFRPWTSLGESVDFDHDPYSPKLTEHRSRPLNSALRPGDH